MFGDQDVLRRIIIKRGYGEEAPWDPIGTGVHHGGLLLDWEGNFGGWGGAEYYDRLRVFNQSYTDVCADMFIWTHSMGYVFMLRGGGTTGAIYHIFSDQPIRGTYQEGTPDIAYSTSTLFYDESWSGNNTYDVAAPAPLRLNQVNSARIDGLRTKKQSQFDSRYAAISHTHDDRYYTESEIDTKLATKAASSHTHAISDVTGLQSALDGKQAAGSYLTSLPSHNHDDRYYTESEVDSLLGARVSTSNFKVLGGGISYDTDRRLKVDNGLAIYGAYSGGSNSPSTYDIAAQFAFSSRAFELSADWLSTTSPSLRLRTLRDCCDNWSSWVDIITSANIGSQSVSSATTATTATNLGTNFTADSWFRATSDNKQVRFYGNSRTMIFRTDGNTNDHGGGAYAYIWYYGGSADNTRRMILNTNGDLWTATYGWLHEAFQAAGSYAASSHTHAISDVTDLQRALDGKAASSHNHDDRYYTESESDGRFLRGTTNPNNVNNFTISIGNNGSYSYVQSHSGQPLYLNPVGNAIVLNSGTTVAGQFNATGVSSGVSLNVGNASTHGVYTADDARKQLVVSADYYPHIALVATGANNTNHGAVFSFVGSEGDSPRQWNIGIPNSNPYIFSIGYNASGDNNPHYGVGDGWAGDDRHHARLSIDRSGNTKIRGMLYVNGTSGGITTGNAVLHAGNYSSYALPLSGGTVTGIAYFQTNNGGKSGATDSAKLQAYSTNNNSAFMSFHKSGHYAVNMGLDDDNVLRIGGWSASANRMQLDMSGNVTFAGNVTGYSDARIKTDIQTIGNALEKVKQLRGVTFKRTDSDDTSTNMGVIAQEVLTVVPEVVSQDASGMYNVAYGNMAGLLIEAIKDQQALIDQQQKQIDELKALIHGLTK